MFSNNNGISARQMKRLLVFDMVSISTLIVPYIAVTFAGKNGGAAVIAAAILAGIYGSVLFWLGKNITTTKGSQVSVSYLNYTKNAVGKAAALVFSIFYFIKFLVVIVFLLNLFTNVIGETMLPDTNRKIILATLLFTAAYGASKGIEKRARLSEVLYFIVLIPIFAFLVTGLRKVDLTDLTPLLSNTGMDKGSLLQAGYLVFLTYTALELVLFAIPYLQKNSQWKKMHGYILQGVAIIGVLQLLIYIVTVGILGVSETGDKIWSAVTTMQIVELPGGFIRRQDGIMLAFWLISIFTVLSSYLFYLIHISYDWIRFYILDLFDNSQLHKSMKRKYFVIFYFILIYWIGTSYMDIEAGTRYIGIFIAYIGMPGSLLIPLIILAAMKLKQQADKYDKRREAAHEK